MKASFRHWNCHSNWLSGIDPRLLRGRAEQIFRVFLRSAFWCGRLVSNFYLLLLIIGKHKTLVSKSQGILPGAYAHGHPSKTVECCRQFGPVLLPKVGFTKRVMSGWTNWIGDQFVAQISGLLWLPIANRLLAKSQSAD